MKAKLLALLLCFVGWSAETRACAALNGGPVTVAQESAIIVWDEANHRQHFIRRASFATKSQDIGFIVPTPSVPELAEANEEAFDRVGRLLKPERRQEVRNKWHFFLIGMVFERRISNTFNSAAASLDDGVTAIFEQHVAGYDAVVLAAEDTAGLGRWLKAHGYHSSPALLKWLEPYVQKRWKLTAFKIPKADKDSDVISSTPVRMSFDTPRPFFPYSEPQNQKPQNGRLLQVLMFAPQRLLGMRGEKSDAIEWSAETAWSDKLTPEKQKGLAKNLSLPESNFANPQWLTVLTDYSPLRWGAEDVFFLPDKDQDSILPPPVITYRERDIYFPVDVLFVLFVIVCLRYRSKSEALH